MRPYALPDGFIHTRRAYNEGRAFVFTVQTTASPETFTLPLEASGSYDFTVDWGDSNSDNVTVWNDAAVTHSYAGAGTYTITIVGIIQGWRFNNGGDKTKIYDIKEWGPLRLGSNNGYFYGCSNLTVSATDILDMSGVTTFFYAFRGCSSLATLDVSTWDTAAVTTFQDAFHGCTSLVTLDVSAWDTSSVIILNGIFTNCSSLTTLDVSAWDTSSVLSSNNVFFGCSSLTTLDVSSWDTSSITAFIGTFRGCSSLATIDVSAWDTSSVTSFLTTFHNCSSLTALAADNWNITSVTTMANFLTTATLTTANYSAILVAFEAQAVLDNVPLHGGNSKYSAGAAANARAALIAAHSWVITDGGPA